MSGAAAGVASSSPSGSATAQQSWVQSLLANLNASANVSTNVVDIVQASDFWTPIGLVVAAHWFAWTDGAPRFITFEGQFNTVMFRAALVGLAVILIKKNTHWMDPPVVKDVKAAADQTKAPGV